MLRCFSKFGMRHQGFENNGDSTSLEDSVDAGLAVRNAKEGECARAEYPLIVGEVAQGLDDRVDTPVLNDQQDVFLACCHATQRTKTRLNDSWRLPGCNSTNKGRHTILRHDLGEVLLVDACTGNHLGRKLLFHGR